MLRFVSLHLNDPRRTEFLQHANHWIGMQAPLSYLASAERCIAVYEGEEMVGGYAFFPGTSARMFELIPQDALESNTFMQARNVSDFVELNCVWFKPSMPSKVLSVHFWSHFWGALFRSPFKHAVYCFKKHKTQLARKYSLGRCTPLYTSQGEHTCTLVFEALDLETIPSIFARGLTEYVTRGFRVRTKALIGTYLLKSI